MSLQSVFIRRKWFISSTDYSPSRTEIRAGTQSGSLKAGTEEEAMGEHYLLTLLSASSVGSLMPPRTICPLQAGPSHTND